MKNILIACGLAFLVGCGNQSAQPRNVKEAVAQPKQPDVPATPKPDYTVDANSYDSVDHAISVLSKAAASGNTTEIVRSDKWLVMQGSAAIEPLGKIFGDEQADPAARIAASRVLRQLGPPAVDALRGGMSSSSQQIRLNAIKGLAYIKPTNKQIIRGMMVLVDDKEQRIRQEAIMSLAIIGPAAQQAAEKRLVEILNDTKENETLRDAAKRALKKVAPRRKFSD